MSALCQQIVWAEWLETEHKAEWLGNDNRKTVIKIKTTERGLYN